MNLGIGVITENRKTLIDSATPPARESAAQLGAKQLDANLTDMKWTVSNQVRCAAWPSYCPVRKSRIASTKAY